MGLVFVFLKLIEISEATNQILKDEAELYNWIQWMQYGTA